MQTSHKGGKRKKKSIEEVVGYAVGHRIRIQILALLNEGSYTPDQIADAVGEKTSKVSHHIKELSEDGAIELAKVTQVRNANQHYYRAVEMPFFSDEEIAAMPPQQRQVLAGLIIQAIMAESLSAFWAGKMHSDPRVWLSWRWFNVDEEGREAIADELAQSWSRVQDIEIEATARRNQSGEKATSVIVATLGFQRHRSTAAPHTAARKL